jgi:hypothetical protein
LAGAGFSSVPVLGSSDAVSLATGASVSVTALFHQAPVVAFTWVSPVFSPVVFFAAILCSFYQAREFVANILARIIHPANHDPEKIENPTFQIAMPKLFTASSI